MGGWAFRTSYFKLPLDSDDSNFPAALADGGVQRLKVDELATAFAAPPSAITTIRATR